MKQQPVAAAPRVAPVGVVCVGLAALLCVGCQRATEVEETRARRAEIRESFREPARTRLAKTYPVTMPVDARIPRIDLEPGDAVTAGQELVAIDLVPFEQAVAEAKAAVAELEAEIVVKDDNRLEEIAAEDAAAAVKAAGEALKAADEEVAAQKARADRAAKDLVRKQALAAKKIISDDELDDAKLAAETSLIELRKQQFYRASLKAVIVAVDLYPRAVAQYVAKKGLERGVLVRRLAQAKARLALAQHRLRLAHVRSPIDGVVLERYEQGDCPLPAGQRLLLLGNLDQLEVVADVLTEDVLRLSPGSEVELEPAMGLDMIPGKVKLIEPAGFTKLSSLGVEQQRVKVIVALTGRHDHLGVSYRLQARFVTGTKSDALVVPRFSVLQAPDRSFYVFRIADRQLRRQAVKVGLRSDLELEIVEGLSPSDAIVARPDATMRDGMKVKVTAAAADEAGAGKGEPPPASTATRPAKSSD